MAGNPTSQRLDLRRVLLVALLVGALVLAGAAGLFAFAARSIDKIHKDEEIHLAWVGLQRMQARTLEEVQTSSIWAEAVSAFARNDTQWMKDYFADYYNEYMHHDVTVAVGSDGQVVMAERVGAPLTDAEREALAAATRPVALALQQNHPPGLGLEVAQSWTGMMEADGVTYVVAASTVVPEDDSVARLATDPVVISMRNISAMVDSLSRDLALEGVEYVTEPRVNQVAFPIVGPEGKRLGVLAWTPSRPGAAVLKRAKPMFIVLISALIGGAVLLWVSLDRIAKALEQNQADLSEARDRAEAASEAKTRFLANISHELRTPLNGVLGMAEIMAHGELSPIQQGHLKILKASGQDLLGMIEQILLVTRLERERVDLETAPFDLDALMEDIADRTRAAVQTKPISVLVDSGVKGLWMGDGPHLKQALECLTRNAANFTTEGHIRLSSTVKGGVVHLSVSDTGPGLDPDFVPRMFDDFAQADESVTRAHDGAGLGLAICKRLIRAMGGDISVNSTLGQGATFTLRLPMVPAPVEDAPAKAA
ncbi:sensor histidine kinase [Brevundimonas poindexterae]|uniref:sensor histidine kinase n=1 Tax=Brevundimonas poindexterae TaxID=74325 RepID=UPI001CFD5898|nr:ATP-binding protein [Brevundimonas poindexterae]